MKVKTKAFTLIEMIVVVSIIGILTLGMTIYLDGTGDRAKNIEAESCAKSLLGNMNNFLYYTLTSKMLKDSDGNGVSPNYYTIHLGGGNSNGLTCNGSNFKSNSRTFCNEVVLGYLDETDPSTPTPYQTFSIKNACQGSNIKLGFYRSGEDNINYIKMNKGFSPLSLEETNIFFITTDSETNKLLYGDIIVLRCNDENCNSRREIGKRKVDARTQTITYAKCKFYKENPANECRIYEDENIEDED